ncbi:FAD/NAD(P)-binding domain-containing protein [Trichocladium antarcticum]|uniref:FAD/NAD(P)-binding domain-containing protein n=1 Tax=Trichocladium antarcticum TaxID=1450529 RepID=A0AAN6UL55_9PEZI|nr:FAD/NAD(P)-binding domain-containing protein [Trichocladium antarcticum]
MPTSSASLLREAVWRASPWPTPSSKQVSIMSCWNGATLLRPMSAPRLPFTPTALILDQLGAWEKVNAASEELKVFYNRSGKGKALSAPHFGNRLVKARSGYSMVWGERQNLLRVLYQNLKDPSRILTNKNVIDIKHDADAVTAICDDGSSFRGNMMIGADGVFSKTRSKLWELAAPDHQDLVNHDRNCLIADYNCLFGIAQDISSILTPGDVDTSYNSGRCAVTIAAEGGKVYWFAQERLSHTHTLGNFPRYTDEDAEAFVARNGDIVLRPGPSGLRLADIWKKTVSSRLVAIEEGKFKLWHWGRIACMGDSIHKSTPNLGAGGNAAIETAATLANGITRLADACAASGRHPTQAEIESMLTEYQRSREVRAAAVVGSSGALARAHNLHGPTSRLFVYAALPRLAEFFPELICNITIGAPKLDFLPLPMASLTGTQPFNPAHGDGMRESKIRRMLFALPLFALFVAARVVLNVGPAMDWVVAFRMGGKIDLATGAVPILGSFYRHRGLDGFISTINSFFFPSMYGYDAASRRQIISFLTDGFIFIMIWIFESGRRANRMTPMQWPLVFAFLGQVLGIGALSPLYCFLHYTLSPIENFSALDQRLTSNRRTAAALPALALTYLIPFYLALAALPGAQPGQQQHFLFLWQLYPVWLALTLWGLGTLWRDTAAEDVLRAAPRDVPVMKWYVGVASVLSAGVWVWAWAWGGHGMRGVFVPRGLLLGGRAADLAGFTGDFLRWDEVFALGAHLVWLGYLFGDLARAGMLREGWWRVMGWGAVGVVAAGPGATLGMGWLLREHILATRRHKDALTVESVARLHGEAAGKRS